MVGWLIYSTNVTTRSKRIGAKNLGTVCLDNTSCLLNYFQQHTLEILSPQILRTDTMAASVNSLPNELVGQIIARLKLEPSSLPHLRSCLLVSKLWKETTLPHLYRHLVLTSSNISTFISTFNLNYSRLPRSLTIQISQELPPDDMLKQHYRNGFQQKNVQYIIDFLPHLESLSTFSLTISTVRGMRFIIPPRMIVSVITALPTSVVNLELDTGKLELNTILYNRPRGRRREVPTPEIICDALRNILPRLVNCRVHMRCVCSRMLGTGPLLDFAPISLPKMKSLAVNCIGDSLNHSQSCARVDPGERTLIDSARSAWDDVTETLKLLVRKEQSHLLDAKFIVMGVI